ncbi:hypothetical protein C1S86_25815 [Vibrio parahaemolyticus]|uniref:hypothetical protein n=1 Tax=Vibrio parahaemolyticus TaxID=670 RepID=UPI0009944AF8|nr:hypothetical protein [Vibrio parahaemolyticus]ELB2889507.1 hypothetical protein [Vibrio parahaemolyticus]OOQ67375.1 hypothetical protein BSR61_24730 [Vibrio parahaemolyticus]PMT73693.1 hypothetical protein C1S97_26350 [Vibrio parahaemolyticus]PMT78825.1 hypothetical protein C1S86_25815 [Vibrio parahaemolyticus]
MKGIVTICVVGFIVMISAVGAFYYFVGVNQPVSLDASDWSNFGSYFGGVVGPVFSFLSIVLLVYTVFQQSENINLATSEAIKLDMLRYVSRADEEIDSWLKTEIATTREGDTAQLSLVVWGVIGVDYVNANELNACLNRLLKLVCSYSSAIALYEDNVDPYFVYKQHYTKAIELIEFLENHVDRLGQMAGPSLGICRHQLEGRG